ncbi:MAG: hypothetical protein JNK15_10415 [Planctomycetes bacterium]|nr:hypothetical protein [Planctomycetota bacterium]
MPRPKADDRPDRWRSVLLVVLLASLVVVVWELVPATWQHHVGWRDTPTLRQVTHAFWYHLNPVALTLAELVLLVGAGGALVAPAPGSSRRWLLGSFAGALLLQVAPRLVPLSWTYSFPPELAEQGRAILAAAAPMDALASAIDLVPLLLAITLGLLRAGVHEERRSPHRAVGSMLVFAMSLQLALLAVVALALVGPLQPDGWLGRGLALLVVAYAATAARRVLRRNGTTGRLGPWLDAATRLLVVLPGWAMVFTGLEAIEFGGQHLLAFGDREGLVTMAELPRYAVHFVARGCATALAGHDLIVRVRSAAATTATA